MPISTSPITSEKETKAIFDWADPFLMESELTQDEKLILRTTRSFARNRLMPGVVHANREQTFDRAIMEEMGQLNFFTDECEGMCGV